MVCKVFTCPISLLPNLALDAKFGKSGIEEVKTLHIIEPTILDFKEFNYDNCSLIDCISLLQSVLNSPHAYNQKKLLLNILLML